MPDDVWVPSAAHGWLAATATPGGGGDSEVAVPAALAAKRVGGSVAVDRALTASLTPRATPELDRAESDMTGLGEVSEAALLHNLYLRYCADALVGAGRAREGGRRRPSRDRAPLRGRPDPAPPSGARHSRGATPCEGRRWRAAPRRMRPARAGARHSGGAPRAMRSRLASLAARQRTAAASCGPRPAAPTASSTTPRQAGAHRALAIAL